MIVKTAIAQLLLTLFLSASPNSASNNTLGGAPQKQAKPEKVEVKVIEVKKQTSRRVRGSFMGFKLETSCDINVSEQLTAALLDYSGPEIMITSLKRHFNRKSKHYCGNAVDMQFRHELIEWLVSEDGQRWLSDHNMLFYIEGRPGSRKLVRYKSDVVYAKYVLENPHATGDHIHINIR